jgi:hypothetical protein
MHAPPAPSTLTAAVDNEAMALRTAAAQRASTSNKLDALMQGHVAYLEQPIARLVMNGLCQPGKKIDRCDGRKSADSSMR